MIEMVVVVFFPGLENMVVTLLIYNDHNDHNDDRYINLIIISSCSSSISCISNSISISINSVITQIYLVKV